MKRNLLISVFLGFFPCTWTEESTLERAILPTDVSIVKNPEKKNEKDSWIVVFVHGIMSIQPHVNLANFMRFMSDDVQKTTYSKAVELMRNDPVFYKNQAMQGLGLQKVNVKEQLPGDSSSALANLLNRVTEQCYPNKTVDAHYYTFGWTGLLSLKQRYLDAKKLFLALEQKVAEFKKQGITPKIKVIGYSHGGNVVLNLGAVKEKELKDSPLVIDEAIFWGMPVQKETDIYINSPVFKKIYHFYSKADRVQKIDVFSFKRLLSRSTFKSRGRRFKLPQKLVQVQIKLTRNAVYTRNHPKLFEHTYNFTNGAIASGNSHLLRDSSPGHAELWFFGWSPVHYRSTFALAPLPTIALAPFFMHILESIEPYTNPENPVIIDVRPEHGLALIKNLKGKRFYSVFNFIEPDKFKELQEIALSFKPDDSYDKKQLVKGVQTAYNTAKKYYYDNWSKAPRRVHKRKLAQMKKIEQKAKQATKSVAQCATCQVGTN